MSTIRYRKFDLAYYEANKENCQLFSNGIEVQNLERIQCPENNTLKLCGDYEDLIGEWYLDGKYIEGEDSEYDLFIYEIIE